MKKISKPKYSVAQHRAMSGNLLDEFEAFVHDDSRSIDKKADARVSKFNANIDLACAALDRLLAMKAFGKQGGFLDPHFDQVYDTLATAQYRSNKLWQQFNKRAWQKEKK